MATRLRLAKTPVTSIDLLDPHLAQIIIDDQTEQNLREQLTFAMKAKFDFMAFKSKKPQPPPVLISLFQEIDGHLMVPTLVAKGLSNYRPHPRAYPSVPVQFTGTLRPAQVEVETEALAQLLSTGTTTLGLYPGFGKTILAAHLVSRLNLLSVILVNREILTTQWYNSFTQNTTAVVWIVGQSNPPPSCDVIICMDTRYYQIDPELRKKIGIMIIDEAHSFCTPGHVGCLLAFEPKYLIIETATLERDDEMHKMVYAMAGTHGVFREVNIEYDVIKIETGLVPVRTNSNHGTVVYDKLVKSCLYNPMRNNLIYNLIIANPMKTFLVLTSLVEHAELVNRELLALGMSSDCLCGTRKTYRDAQVLVGTVSKIGTGFDQKNACADYGGRPFDILIMASSIKKQGILIQSVGRVFRTKYPVVMFLVDNDKTFENHWTCAKRWFVTTGGKITVQAIDPAMFAKPMVRQRIILDLEDDQPVRSAVDAADPINQTLELVLE